MATIRCRRCDQEKQPSLFSKDASRKSGLHPWCKECKYAACRIWDKEHLDSKRQSTANWRAANPEKSKELNKEQHHKHKEKRNAYCREYRTENLEHMRELGRKWSRDNPEKANVIQAAYRSKKHNATPSWAKTEFELLVVREAYALAKKRSELTGVKWHVDHIVPIKSTRVCGLHCAANLQVVTAKHNVSKGNRVWPDM